MSTKVLSKSGVQVRIYRDAEELALKAAQHFARLADQYVVGRGLFTVALAGGSTPRAMFKLLADTPFRETSPWSRIFFFWGDERCVPPDHPDSNYLMAQQTLLSKVPVPRQNIFRIPAELEDHDHAAELYCQTLSSFFLSGLGKSHTQTAPLSIMPRFDLILLGMGADGHTASLFPQTKALHMNDRIAVANFVPKFNTYRITLTATAINNARNVTFIVSGDDKAEALKEVLEGPYRPEIYPSQMVHPSSGTLLWMVDEAAARMLQT
jgi:6-phosphogluconolactonase